MRLARRATGALLSVAVIATVAACRADTTGGAAGRQPTKAATAATRATSSASSRTTAGRATRTVRFRAFTPGGRPTTPVRDSGSGSCFTTSITVPRGHAYRCLAGNQLLDPCFASPAQAHPSTVVCYSDPWSAGRRVTLRKPLPRVTPMAHPRPWAIRLANGARCVAVTGVVQSDHGVAMTYQCAGHRAAGLIHGGARRLLAAYGRPPNGALGRVAVTTAWTG